MDSAPWNGLVTAILYTVEYRMAPGRVSAGKIATDLVENPLWKLSPRDEYEILSAGLSSGLPVPKVVDSQRSDEEIRGLLAEVIEGMDSLRPWPRPPFERLPENRLNDFISVTPIASTETPVNDLEAHLRSVFDYRQDYGEFLLIRLRSGLEIGFLHPFSAAPGHTIVASANKDSGLSAQEAVRELAISTGLAWESFDMR
ncbi:hypothetical protein [Nocardia sp. X0981]